MYDFSEIEIREQVLAFMRELDIYPLKDTNLILDGQLHRYVIEGDSPHSKNGAYCIYTDGVPAGYLQNWKTGLKTTWKFDMSNFNRDQLKYFNSKEYKKRAEEKRIVREKTQQEKQAKASESARIFFEQLEKEPHGHPYLVKKDISPYNLRLNKSANSLAVPLHDVDGKFVSLQWIDASGNKRFFPEAPTKGVFWSIALDTLKNDKSDVILLGEGFATMAKVYELSNYPCVAAMNCGNLFDVAQALKNKFPNAQIVVMSDDDKETEIKRGFNPGKIAAEKIVEAKLAKGFFSPPFKSPAEGTDWDDFAIKYGNEKVASYMKELISWLLLTEQQKNILKRVEQIDAQTLRTKVFAPIKWAVEGFLPSGLSILAGGPKVGKSILALHLALAVVTGGCALGQIPVKQGAVLYLALEDTQRRLQERIAEACISEDCDLSELTLVTRVPRQHEGGLEYIQFWLDAKKEKARLVIIDTLQKFRKQLTNKGNMYSEDYDVVSEIKKLADEFDVPFFIIHHLKKTMQDDWLNEISGTQGIAGAADTLFSLKRARTENQGILHRTGRDVEEKDFNMRLDGFNWILEGERENFTMPEWKKNIINYLKEHDNITPMDLSTVLSQPVDNVRHQLKRLLKEGTVRKTGYGKYSLSD